MYAGPSANSNMNPRFAVSGPLISCADAPAPIRNPTARMQAKILLSQVLVSGKAGAVQFSKKYRVQDRRGCRRSQGGGDLARARRLAAMVAKATWLVSTAYESATVQTGESDVRTLPSNSSVRRATDRQNRGRLNASASSTVEWILLQRRRFVRGHALGDLPAPSGEIARRLSLCPPACGSLRLMGRRDRV